ncbi:hypothetical protein QE363_002283 [Sphingomonas sp. SORGH_AS870]|uniref:hypothetical protein n=1 Tax=Sphingomonas sp. SORGH_AS_0870 TaxID=3041801 RepID=UPI002854282A|nr:hypothetical protein [Sphingomonas sp. SORGH_AS_0870]MDR6146490.1 hypothetical protein [Sphingomonas sp. SORGH_AS_0870]
MTTYIPRQLSYYDKEGGRVIVPEAALGNQPLPVVILGDPGMGKSELLRALSTERGYSYLTAAQFLRRPISALPQGVLLLDALDEVSAGKEGDPLEWVLARLGEAGWPDFVLSCRAAEWRGSGRAQAIADDYGRAAKILTLEPLSLAESVALMEGELGVKQAQQFHAALHHHGLITLLSNPQSLKLLIEAADGGIPDSRADLFDRAARKMLAEHNDKHVQSELNRLDPAMAMDAAGAAMAMLLLGGKEGVFVGLQAQTPAPFLHAASLATLPFAESVSTVLMSRLFRTAGEVDSFKDCHRTVAEYLGARWLGRVVDASTDPARLVKRLLALIYIGGRVPASLRGLHAWLAHASPHFADTVIATDPYGVMRYGNLGAISVQMAEFVWDSLAAYGEENPWFRGGDWQRFSIAGLVQQGLGSRLSELLNNPRSSFHLRSLALNLLQGGACVSEMRETLLAIIVDPDRTYSERHDAVCILADWTSNSVDWPALFCQLCTKGDIEAPRLADEALAIIGVGRFSDAAIAEIVLAGYGGFTDEAGRRRLGRSDDYWSLSQAMPMERCAGLLDALATHFAPGQRGAELVHHDRGFGHLVWTLLARQIPGETPDPTRLWRWLDAFSDYPAAEPGPRAVIAAWLASNATLRQAIQEIIYLTPDGAAARERKGWHLGHISHGLYFQDADVIAMFERLTREGRRDAFAQDLFERLVRGWNSQGDWTPDMAAYAKTYAADDASLLAVLHPAPCEESAETRKLMAKFAAQERAGERRRERKKRAARKFVLAKREQLLAGKGPAGPLALCFLGYSKFGGRDHPPAERIGAWIGDDLREDVLAGFEASLQCHFDGTLHDLAARVLDRDDSHDSIWPLVAGLAQRHLDGRGFTGVSEDHLLAALIAHRLVMNIVDKHLKGFSEALENYALANAVRFERFLRAMIEPQLNANDGYFRGTHYLFGGRVHAALRASLLLEWFEPIAGSHAIDLEALVDALLEVPQPYQAQANECVDRLIECAPPRASGEDRTPYWQALRILRDFEGARETLEVAAQAPEFLWALQKAVGHHRFDSGRIRVLPPDRLAWIFSQFEARWPEVDRPRGTTTGSRHPWDAGDFLRAVLFRLADDTSAGALQILHRLVEVGSESYAESLRAARAKQRTKAAEADYVSPGVPAIAAAVREAAPLAPVDVKAIALDAIADLQARIAGAATDTADLFYDGNIPKNEERCRNTLLDLLGPTLPFGIVWAPEERMPHGKRADAGFRLGEVRIPLEAKLAWNPAIWSACTAQLDRLYASADYMACGHGIYLIFWFGVFTSDGTRIPVPLEGVRPQSPSELAAMLRTQLADDAALRLSIVVLDLTRRKPQNRVSAGKSA